MSRSDALGRSVAAAAAALVVLLLAGCGVVGPGSGGARGGGGMHGVPLSCAPPAPVPGRRVTVTMTDMGMMGGVAPLGSPMLLTAAPAAFTAGRITFVAENRGWRTHELVVLPLPPGAAAGGRPVRSDGTVDEAGSLGEASAGCAAGPGDGIRSGQVGWVTVTLRPGRYELVCNERNHYADGMRRELVVT